MQPGRYEFVQQQCSRCPTTFAADTLPAVIKKRQNHLRREHPQAWLDA